MYRRILTPTQASAEQACPACSKPLKRTPKPPTAQVMETLDNGFMARRIERPADAERLYAERAKADGKSD